MKKTGLSLSLLLTIVFNSPCQQISKSQKVSIDKWVHAIINIECLPSMGKQMMEVGDLLSQNKITQQEYRRKVDSINLASIRFGGAGTAIYLLHNKHHYLLTARHVLNDTSVRPDGIFPKIILINDINHPGKTTVVDAAGNMSTEIQPFLMLYEWYEFSSTEDDIGIISLDNDNEGIEFRDTLDKRGYIPINSDDINQSCNIKRGQKMISIGYPQDFSLAQIKNLPLAAFLWQSLFVTRPIVTNGLIADELKNKNYFYGDIFVYHGNSGGPAIVDNKLVGIVHGAIVDTSSSGAFHYGLYHTQFIKSSLILPMLKQIDYRIFGDKR